MPTEQIVQFLVIAAVLMLSSIVYGTVGFAFGLFANPLLLLAGLPLQAAMATASSSMSASSIASLINARRHVQWRALLPVVITATLMLPLGALALVQITQLDRAQMRAVYGSILLVVIVAQRLLKVRPRPRVHTGWAIVTGVISGFIAGTAGVGGPPIVLWAVAHDWTGLQLRATLWAIFVLLVPVQLILLCMAFDSGLILFYVAAGLLGLPVVLLGTALGVRIGNRLPIERLRLAALLLLVFLAAVLIAGPKLPESAAVAPTVERP